MRRTLLPMPAAVPPVGLGLLLGLGLLTGFGLLAGCAPMGGSGADPNTPGATGRTVVPGSNSTVAGDAAATEMQQKWGIGRGR